jgi:hypothetical protein
MTSLFCTELKYLYIKMYVCMYVCACMFHHNSGTPGVISIKLGTHMTICIYKNLINTSILYIYFISIYKMDVCVYVQG